MRILNSQLVAAALMGAAMCDRLQSAEQKKPTATIPQKLTRKERRIVERAARKAQLKQARR